MLQLRPKQDAYSGSRRFTKGVRQLVMIFYQIWMSS